MQWANFVTSVTWGIRPSVLGWVNLKLVIFQSWSKGQKLMHVTYCWCTSQNNLLLRLRLEVMAVLKTLSFFPHSWRNVDCCPECDVVKFLDRFKQLGWICWFFFFCTNVIHHSHITFQGDFVFKASLCNSFMQVFFPEVNCMFQTVLC